MRSLRAPSVSSGCERLVERAVLDLHLELFVVAVKQIMSHAVDQRVMV